jgi:hypothetical protein
MFLFVAMAVDYYFWSYGNICSLPLSSFVGSPRYRDFAMVPCTIVVLLLRAGVCGVVLCCVVLVLCWCIKDIIYVRMHGTESFKLNTHTHTYIYMYIYCSPKYFALCTIIVMIIELWKS